ncbi:hypothetical protein BKA81DRAFT_401201 [Phyllosticta paracitricarpa]
MHEGVCEWTSISKKEFAATVSGRIGETPLSPGSLYLYRVALPQGMVAGWLACQALAVPARVVGGCPFLPHHAASSRLVSSRPGRQRRRLGNGEQRSFVAVCHALESHHLCGPPVGERRGKLEADSQSIMMMGHGLLGSAGSNGMLLYLCRRWNRAAAAVEMVLIGIGPLQPAQLLQPPIRKTTPPQRLHRPLTLSASNTRDAPATTRYGLHVFPTCSLGP